MARSDCMYVQADLALKSLLVNIFHIDTEKQQQQ